MFAGTVSLTTLTRLQTPFFVFFSLDSQFRSLDTLYTKPYTRIGGYLAGVWTGYYLSNTNKSWSVRKVSTSLRLRHVRDLISVSLFETLLWFLSAGGVQAGTIHRDVYFHRHGLHPAIQGG